MVSKKIPERKVQELTLDDLAVEKFGLDVNPNPVVALLGEGDFAKYMLSQLVKNGVNVRAFLTNSRVKGKMGGVSVGYFSDGRDLRGYFNSLHEEGVEYFLMAYYSKRLPKSIVQEHGRKTLNFHPSILPLFRGSNPIEDMLESGLEEGGVTIHFVNEEYDTGDILVQREFKLIQLHNPSRAAINYKIATQVGAQLFKYALDNIRYIKPISQKGVYDRIVGSMSGKGKVQSRSGNNKEDIIFKPFDKIRFTSY